jgi:hypothetical protein
MPNRVQGAAVEAEIWGHHALAHVCCCGRLTVRTMQGAYGTLWEVETACSWHFQRHRALLGEVLPPGVRPFPIPEADEDPDDAGVFIAHYWEDTRHRANSRGNAPTQVRKPAH